MILIEKLSELPKITFKAKTSDKPDEKAEYCFYHKSLKFYSCFFNIPVIELKKIRRKKHDSDESISSM